MSLTLKEAAALPIHEAAECFPPLDGPAFDELVEDIRTHGLREPIVLTADGKVLDGRNRLGACLKAGVEPTFRTFRGPGKAIQYVISANLRRRHLNTSQRAMAAAQLADLRQGARTDLASNDAISQPEAAARLNVSRKSVQRAAQVHERGTKELVQAVRDGDLTVGAASEAVALPPEAQREVVRQVKKGVKPSAAIPKTKTTTQTAPAAARAQIKAIEELVEIIRTRWSACTVIYRDRFLADVQRLHEELREERRQWVQANRIDTIAIATGGTGPRKERRS